MTLLKIDIPLNEPVIIISLILLILLIGPVLFERIRIPSIVGLLICGAIIGPQGLNLVTPDLEFSLLGTIGLLYLMFLAGLEIDLVDFKVNKSRSLLVGLSTFVIPFLVGFLVCRYLLNYNNLASLLIASMFSSHTLISYPLLGKLGIVNKSIVTIVVAATIIADILALIAMELVTKIARVGFEINAILYLGLNFIIFFTVVLIIVPKISRLFLSRYEGDLGVQYVFILFMLFLSSAVAYLLEIEPILGAFFCGLVLNRQIINTSPLYKRIEFIGNNLFIPFFLISIGILADFKVYVNTPNLIAALFVFILTAFLGKYLAALLSKIILKLSTVETSLLFGLSVSRAASAIAIILIGFNIGMVEESVLNNTVILILVTSIASSYITQKSGKKMLVKENDTISEEARIHQKILVPLANPSSMKSLLDFAVLIKNTDEHDPIYPLTIFTQMDDIRNKIDSNRKAVKKVISSLNTDIHFEPGSRIDTNVTNGVVRASEEISATSIVIGWNSRSTPFQLLFGTVLNNLLEKTPRMVIVLKTTTTIRNIKRIQLFVPKNAQFEKGFTIWLNTLFQLVKKLKVDVVVNCSSADTSIEIYSYYQKKNFSKYFNINEDYNIVANPYQKAELLFFVHSRKEMVSYEKHFDHLLHKMMSQNEKVNSVIIYPEQ